MKQEDIEIEAYLYEDSCHNPSIQQHFIDGANYAKETLFKEACEWLKANSYAFRSDEFLEPLIEAMKGE